uniref:GMP phosphodiesterase delta subunit domain-containing protein n=1 Tax=Romanomermis culicivorax TaxID=13658 RepID=A0A915HIX8_ROMCU
MLDVRVRVARSLLERNWMNLRDADTGKILWQSTDDMSQPTQDHEDMTASIKFSIAENSSRQRIICSHVCQERLSKLKCWKEQRTLELDIPTEAIVNRLKDHWITVSSGRIYNTGFNPPKILSGFCTTS